MININTHSSIKICEDGPVAYFDPWKIIGAPHDADVICVTHDHFDHYSVDDIKKISKNETVLIAPESYKERISKELANERIIEAIIPSGKKSSSENVKGPFDFLMGNTGQRRDTGDHLKLRSKIF